ncbi:MAG TPA: ATP synthase F1 subunit gamma [Nitrospiria bacterium]|nr:ATP synthase F1 subunit gamma [Nitrospiria bacterium]
MPSLQNIRRRIGSVKNTQKITKAMKLVSGAKLRRAQDRILAARPYAQKMAELLQGLGASVQRDLHPLWANRGERRIHLLVIAADRGLCGSFNANIVRKALEVIREKERKGLQVDLTLVGKKARDYFRKRPYTLRKTWTNIFDKLDFGHAAEIARDIEQAFLEGQFDVCDLIFTEFRSAASQRVVVERLLPIGAMDSAASTSYLYEPSEEEIFERLLPKYIEVQLFRSLLESNASELGARMMAMDAATRNAQEMIYKLTRVYNKTRQAAITKELMDIIGGAEALK